MTRWRWWDTAACAAAVLFTIGVLLYTGTKPAHAPADPARVLIPHGRP